MVAFASRRLKQRYSSGNINVNRGIERKALPYGTIDIAVGMLKRNIMLRSAGVIRHVLSRENVLVNVVEKHRSLYVHSAHERLLYMAFL